MRRIGIFLIVWVVSVCILAWFVVPPAKNKKEEDYRIKSITLFATLFALGASLL